MLGAAGRVDGEHQTQKVIEGMTDTRIGQLVAGSASFGYRHHQPAAPQTTQVVGHDLARHSDLLGEFGGMVGSLAQVQQDLGPRRVGQGMSEPGQGIGVKERLHARTKYIRICIQKKVYRKLRGRELQRRDPKSTEFLHRHAKKARLNVSFDPTDQPPTFRRGRSLRTDLQIR